MARIHVRDVWLLSDALTGGTEHQNTGNVKLTSVITALGSANKIRVTITNDDASYAFTGNMHIKFYMTGMVVAA